MAGRQNRVYGNVPGNAGADIGVDDRRADFGYRHGGAARRHGPTVQPAGGPAACCRISSGMPVGFSDRKKLGFLVVHQYTRRGGGGYSLLVMLTVACSY